ncbi:MAG: hypothetical protein ACLGQH_05240 [Acidobacteriota bacterium]
MNRYILRAALALWLVQLLAAVALGALRQFLLAPVLGDMFARAVGTLVLCAVIWAIAARFVRRHPGALGQRLGVGALWCLLTLAFEFLAGHYLFGTPWPTLAADWNMAAGHLWPLVPATCLLAPALAGRRDTARSERQPNPGHAP